MARPGIMVYFDMLGPIKVLPDADKGRLFVAMLEYGQNGIEPQFDGMLALAWEFVKPKLDRDDETYENAKIQRRYAAFCKKRSAGNLPKIPFEDWINMSIDERERSITTDNESLRAVNSVPFRYPTTTATATSITPTSAIVAAAATANTDTFAAATAEKQLKIMKGELGKGVVMLTDEQVEDLLQKLDLDGFDYYVDKLASFIIKNGAKVKNHYETILRWWRQDSDVQ